MFLVVGLGNPGDKYIKTRHNVGFLFLDYLAHKNGLEFGKSKWKADIVKTSLYGESVVLVKPLTFMNLSGTAVAQIKSYYKTPLQNIMVVHDDLDLEFGRLKIIEGRGAGGHNGIRSMIENLGGKGFVRFRVGIGRPESEQESSSYVLSKMSNDEMQCLEERFSDIEKGIQVYFEKGIVEAMNLINPVNK